MRSCACDSEPHQGARVVCVNVELRQRPPIRVSINDENLGGHALRPRHRRRHPGRDGGDRENRQRAAPRGRLLPGGGGLGLGAMPARREEAAAVVRVEGAAAAPRRLDALPGRRLGQVLQGAHGGERGEGLRLAVEEPGQAPLQGELRHERGHLEAVRVRARGGAGGVVVELRRGGGARGLPGHGRGRGLGVRRRADVLLLLRARGGPTAVEQEVCLHDLIFFPNEVQTPIRRDESRTRAEGEKRAAL